MGIPYSDISEMTGSIDPNKRNQEWKEKRCFFVTPQVLHNDLNRGAVDASKVIYPSFHIFIYLFIFFCFVGSLSDYR